MSDSLVFKKADKLGFVLRNGHWDEKVLFSVFPSAHPEAAPAVSHVQPRAAAPSYLECLFCAWFGAGKGASLHSIPSPANLLHTSDP